MQRRLGISKLYLAVQSNIAQVSRKGSENSTRPATAPIVYFGHFEAYGEEHRDTIMATSNCAASLKRPGAARCQIIDTQYDARGAAFSETIMSRRSE